MNLRVGVKIEYSKRLEEYLKDQIKKSKYYELIEYCSLKKVEEVTALVLKYKPEVDDPLKTDYYINVIEVYLQVTNLIDKMMHKFNSKPRLILSEDQF